MPESIRDLQRKFVDTFVAYKRSGSTLLTPLNVHDVVEQDGHVLFMGRPLGGQRVVSVKYDNLFLSPPALGSINVDKIAMFLSRTPTRQWKEGFTWNTTQHQHLAQEAVALLGIKDPWKDRAQLLPEIFNPTYPSYREALQEVVEGDGIVRAFNNKYWVGVAPFTNSPVLGYKFWYVGKIDGEGRVALHNRANHLKEEVSMYAEVVQ